MRSTKVAIVLGAAVLLIAAQVASRGQTTPTPSEGSKPAPAAEGARKYIENAEKDLFDLGVTAARADWVKDNFITEDTEQIAADAGEVVNTASTKYAKEAHQFDGLKLAPELARKRLLLELSAGVPAPDDPKAQKERAKILASIDGDYGKGKWCRDGVRGKCLEVTRMSELMAESSA